MRKRTASGRNASSWQIAVRQNIDKCHGAALSSADGSEPSALRERTVRHNLPCSVPWTRDGARSRHVACTRARHLTRTCPVPRPEALPASAARSMAAGMGPFAPSGRSAPPALGRDSAIRRSPSKESTRASPVVRAAERGSAALQPGAGSESRLHGLDALRGVAALLVMLFHYTTRYQEKFRASLAPGVPSELGLSGRDTSSS